jgi:hypothetical protein
MPASTDLVERSGDLKAELVSFAQGPRFSRSFRRAVRQRFGKVVVGDEGDVANFLDHFILQYRLPDGRTIVECFVAARPDLPERERAMLLGWRDVLEGIFEVLEQDGEALIVLNLVDELTYRVRSNMGPAVFAQMPRRSFLIARLVPIEDEWLISGMTSVLSADRRAEVQELAAQTAMSHPALVFRNPDKLAKAWELQREDRGHFMAFFGSDFLVLPGPELAERMQGYWAFHNREVRKRAARSAAEGAEQEVNIGLPVPDFDLPDHLRGAPTVAVIYDETEGLNFFANFGPVQEVFADPELAADQEHRRALLGYLKDPSVSPLPFRRLAEQDPERASRVFQQALRQPDFEWPRDGEALLRRHKASFFERPALPSIMPVGGAALDHSRPLHQDDMSPSDPRPTTRTGTRDRRRLGRRQGQPPQDL